VVIAVQTRSTIENRANDFQAAIDGGCARVGGQPLDNERLECGVVDLMSLEVSNVRHQQRTWNRMV